PLRCSSSFEKSAPRPRATEAAQGDKARIRQGNANCLMRASFFGGRPNDNQFTHQTNHAAETIRAASSTWFAGYTCASLSRARSPSKGQPTLAGAAGSRPLAFPEVRMRCHLRWLCPTDAWARFLIVPVLVFIAMMTDRGYLADFWHHLTRGQAIVEEGELL